MPYQDLFIMQSVTGFFLHLGILCKIILMDEVMENDIFSLLINVHAADALFSSGSILRSFHHVTNYWNTSAEWLCQLSPFLQLMSLVVRMAGITRISHLLAARVTQRIDPRNRPHPSHKISATKRNVIFTVIVWILSALIGIPAFMYQELLHYDSQGTIVCKAVKESNRSLLYALFPIIPILSILHASLMRSRLSIRFTIPMRSRRAGDKRFIDMIAVEKRHDASNLIFFLTMISLIPCASWILVRGFMEWQSDYNPDLLSLIDFVSSSLPLMDAMIVIILFSSIKSECVRQSGDRGNPECISIQIIQIPCVARNSVLQPVPFNPIHIPCSICDL
jgi:hypothetical protein